MNQEEFIEEIEEHSVLKPIILRIFVLIVSIVMIVTAIFQPRFFIFLT